MFDSSQEERTSDSGAGELPSQPAELRVEDAALLTGRSRFTADLRIPGLHEVYFVRSTLPHARITNVDSADAVTTPGVVAVYCAGDLPELRIRAAGVGDLLPSALMRPVLAVDRVRFVGEIVAVVVAVDLARAIDAAEKIQVEYDPLPPVVTLDEGRDPSSQPLFPEIGTNTVLTLEMGQSPTDPRGEVLLRQRIVNPRMAVAPMEGNAIVVVPEDGGTRFTVHASTQTPHGLRDCLADALGSDPSAVRVITPAVGGGFGGKVYMSAEYGATALVAQHTGLPVRWVQPRNENLLTMHGRDHSFDVCARATPDGRVHELDVASWTNAGAYPGFGCHISLTARTMATGPYRIGHLTHRLNCVATNTAPTGAFRGAGRPEATHVLERCMDILAHRLGIDPAEIRRRNLLTPNQFPYEAPSGAVYDTGEYVRSLDAAMALVEYDRWRAEQSHRRELGSPHFLGIGISTYVELSAAGPGIDGEFAQVEIDQAGRFHVGVGTAAHGQGHYTTYAGIISRLFGIEPDAVLVVDGDTELVPRGAGTGGSRSGQVGGSAVLLAGRELLAKAKELAAHLLEAAIDDIEVRDGIGLAVRGAPVTTLGWAELARSAADVDCLPPGMEAGLKAAPGFQMAPGGTAPFGCHIAVVEIDAETGRTALLRMAAVDDCGRVLNPIIATGQIHGGIAAGIGQALFEHISYDDDANPVNVSFAEYLMPSAADLPSYSTGHTITPTIKNPLGAKGIGEAGTTGSLAAVHNAVIDGLAHLGVEHLDLPLSPERIWRAINRTLAP